VVPSSRGRHAQGMGLSEPCQAEPVTILGLCPQPLSPVKTMRSLTATCTRPHRAGGSIGRAHRQP
jgi:hypothetical protein